MEENSKPDCAMQKQENKEFAMKLVVASFSYQFLVIVF